jgi:hypothetical protein
MKKSIVLSILFITLQAAAAPIFEFRDSANNQTLLLRMTDEIHNNAFDSTAILKAEFGNSWELADWKDIKRFTNTNSRVTQLADYMRLNNYYVGPPRSFSSLVTVQNDGVKTDVFNYPYFMAANYGDRPDFYPHHDDLNNDTLTLHNWAANAHILGAVKTDINVFKTVSASAETQFLSAASDTTTSTRRLRSTRVSIDEMIDKRPERRLVEESSEGFQETAETLGKSYSIWSKIMDWLGFGSNARDQVVGEAIDQISKSGKMQERCLKLTASGTTTGALDCVEVLTLESSSPAGFVYENIDANVGGIEFDFRLENFDTNDQIFLMFNGERIFDFNLQDMLNDEFYRSEFIDLSGFNLAGGNFGIGINSDAAGRMMDITSLRFFAKSSTSPIPSVSSPSVFLICLTGCMWLFCYRRQSFK